MRDLNLSAELPLEVLQRAIALREKIDELTRELDAILGGAAGHGKTNNHPPGKSRKNDLSAAGRARIAEAQRKRWAKYNASKPLPARKPPGETRLSPKGREKVSAAMKARWERYRAAKALGINM